MAYRRLQKAETIRFFQQMAALKVSGETILICKGIKYLLSESNSSIFLDLVEVKGVNHEG